MSEPTSFAVDDAVYLNRSGGALLARLYRPLRQGPLPAIVDIHGGRWCAETRLTNAAIDEALAASGIFVMAPDFRAPPEARHPEPVADINFAIRWLKTHASEYGLDPAWIGGLGTSSGGHQLLLNALTPDAPEFAGDPAPDAGEADAALAYVVVCWPVVDPLARYRYAVERNMTIHIESHHAYWADEAAMAAGNPQLMLERGQVDRLPPTLLVQGDEDVILPRDSAERFAQAYARAGGALVLKKFVGAGHTFITKDPDAEASRGALAIIKEFIHSRTDRR